MATKKRQPVGENGSAIQDISHEEVLPGKNDVSVIPKIMTPEDQLKLEIVKFNIADAGIAKLKENYGKLKINGADDKNGYKAVREAWSEVRTVRTSLEKKGKSLRDGYLVVTKGIKKEEDRLIESLTPLEDDLYKKWKDIDEEKERVKKEAEEAEQRQLMERIEELQTLGMVFSDGFYRVGETITMDVASIRTFPVEQYEKLKVAVKAKADEIQAAKDKADQEEADRKAAFERDQQELKEKQQKFEEDQRKFQEQQDQLKRDQEEAAKQKLQMRLQRLESMGMKSDSDSVVYSNGFTGFGVEISSVDNFDDAQWSQFLAKMAVDITEANEKKAAHDAEVAAEQAENDRRKKYIAEELAASGMAYDYNSDSFVFVSNVMNISLVWNDFAGLDDEAIKSKAFDYRIIIDNAKEAAQKQADDEKAAQEKEEQLAMSDGEKFNLMTRSVVNYCSNIDTDIYTTKKYKDKASSFKTKLVHHLTSITATEIQ